MRKPSPKHACIMFLWVLQACTDTSVGGGAVEANGGGGTAGAGAHGGMGGVAASMGATGGGGAATGGTGGAPIGGASGASTGGASSGGVSGAGASPSDAGETCIRARLLWSEDFETDDYSRWTGGSYGDSWGNACQSSGFSTDRAVSGTRSHRSEIVCSYTAEGNVHRGYGGIQFDGDTPLDAYTNAGVGIDAPYGVVNTYHSWLETSTVFQNGTWFSFWTINDACDWSSAVLTLGLEDPSRALAAAHYWANGGGERTYLNGPPAFPLNRWVRTTIYVNYYDEVMHVWQDGVETSHVTFDRTQNTICQWHWGAYASGDNTDIVLYEDDNSIWKLLEPWTDFSREPHLGEDIPICP